MEDGEYIVEKIYEDDFGCEERPENYEPQVIVSLRDAKGAEQLLRQPDVWLYRQRIEEGSRVRLTGGRLYSGEE